jgi:hypothetical protein
MINLVNDISVSTMIISFVIMAVGWGAKEIAKSLIKHLIETAAKVQLLESKIGEVLNLANSIPKIQKDLNIAFQKIEDLETEVRQA